MTEERLRPKRQYSWLVLLPSIAVALLGMTSVILGGSTEEAESSMRVLGGILLVLAVVTALVKEWREKEDGNES